MKLPGSPNPALHGPTFRLNSVLFAFILVLGVVLGLRLPERYAIHFGLGGTPDGWAEGPGMWVLLLLIVVVATVPVHLLQRYLVAPANVSWLNLPYKEEVLTLPDDRRLPIIRRMNRMVGITSTVILLLFVDLLLRIHLAAVSPDSTTSRVTGWMFVPLLLGVILVPIVELVGLARMIRRESRTEDERLEDGSSTPS